LPGELGELKGFHVEDYKSQQKGTGFGQSLWMGSAFDPFLMTQGSTVKSALMIHRGPAWAEVNRPDPG
jgi:hypothetical protein